jgi:predicted PurR-regulated permease PerM
VTTGERQQVFFWSGALVLIFVLIYFLSPILLPFVAGSVIAYFLSPVVTRLGRWGVRRSFGAAGVLLLFLLTLLLIAALLVPLVQIQVAELAPSSSSRGLPSRSSRPRMSPSCAIYWPRARPISRPGPGGWCRSC